MKRLIILLVLLLCACSKTNDTEYDFTREPLDDLDIINRGPDSLVLLDNLYLASDFAITSSNRLVSREAKTTLSSIPELPYSEPFDVFNVQVYDLKTKMHQKTIDLNRILKTEYQYFPLSTQIFIFEDDHREFLQVRLIKKVDFDPYQKSVTIAEDQFSTVDYVSFLQVDIDTEDYRIIRIKSTSEIIPENIYIPESFSMRSDSKAEILSAVGSEKMKITMKLRNLPLNNKRLYSKFPELKEARDLEIEKLTNNTYQFDATEEPACVIYIEDYIDEADLLTFISEDY